MQQTNPMRMERRRLADLIPAAYNPRKALTPEDPEYQDIKASIQGLGYADPIVINYDGTIIKGHQRRTVMMDMGIEEAEVVVLDIRDKAKEKMINVALNKITGKWDLQILKDLLSDLDLNGYDFSVTGFHQDDLEDLIQQLDVPEEAHDDDFDPDAAKEEIEAPVTRRGDIWKLGRHRLMCGDATSLDDAEILMAGNKLDLVITDPPYNVDYGAKVGFLNDYLDQMLREYKDQTTVHFEPKPTRNDMHPTMKPVPLIGRLMNNSSRPGWMVGDFFAGSGSTLMAAEQLGRTAFCMELDEKNCDVIIKRWETYTGQKAEKL